MSDGCNKCESPEPGETIFCERHNCYKTSFLWKKCQERGSFWEQWEDAKGPGQNGKSDPLPKKKGGCKKKADSSITGDGPGSQLVAIFSRAGVPHCQSCMGLAYRMNEWGAAGCEEHFDEIVDQILPRAKQWLAKNKQWVHRLMSATNTEDMALRLGIQRKVRQAIKMADVPRASLDNLAVIACHFNPYGYRRPRDHFMRFAEGIRDAGVQLFSVELAYDDDPFVLSDASIQLRGCRKLHMLWQKERLLNIAIANLPESVDAVAWIDGDVLFDSTDWPEQTLQALESRPVVQMFDTVAMLGPTGHPEMRRKSCGWYYQQNRAAYADLSIAHPGFAWAGRADWVRRHGLYEYMITGGGDSMMLPAFTDAYLNIIRTINPEWLQHLRPWVDAVSADVGRKFGFVPGQIRHMYHGAWQARQYMQRWEWLRYGSFTPETDVCIDETGLLAWTDYALQSKTHMVNRVKEYFSERMEDG